MKRLVMLLFALMMLSPSVVAAQEVSWSEGFDPANPDCTTFAEDCESLIAWLTSQDGVEVPTPTPTSAPVVAPSGDWAFVEDYRVQMMDAAEFVCKDVHITDRIATVSFDFREETWNSRDVWDEVYPGQMDDFFVLQDELEAQLQLEYEAETPLPDGMIIPEHAYTAMQILEYLERERGYENCNSIDLEL